MTSCPRVETTFDMRESPDLTVPLHSNGKTIDVNLSNCLAPLLITEVLA
jgi:hypothetical protein